MLAKDAYQWLIDRPEGVELDPFDRHALASVLAIGIEETAKMRRILSDTVGLDAEALVKMAANAFPHALAELRDLAGACKVVRAVDEDCIRDLLWRSSNRRTTLERHLACMIARRAQRPNHLWQDMGLQSRTELGRLMGRHFRVMVKRNSRDMKWKKFLYRVICRDEGLGFCTAPSCSECDDLEFLLRRGKWRAVDRRPPPRRRLAAGALLTRFRRFHTKA